MMSDQTVNRRRAIHFSHAGKNLLVDLVAEDFNVIENKRADCASQAEKAAAWARLSEKFNACSPLPRTPDQLRNCWSNLKQNARSVASNNRVERCLTVNPVNSKPSISKEDVLLNKVRGILDVVIDGLPNAFDNVTAYRGDAIRFSQPVKTSATAEDTADAALEVQEILVVPTSVYLDRGEVVTNENCPPTNEVDWSSWNLQSLRQKVTLKLGTSGSSQETSSISNSSPPPPLLDAPIFPSSLPEPEPEPKPESVGSPNHFDTSSITEAVRRSSSKKRWSSSEGALSDAVLQAKLELIKVNHRLAEEEAERKQKLFDQEAELNKTIIEEKLKQEKLKTELLRLQLQRFKKHGVLDQQLLWNA